MYKCLIFTITDLSSTSSNISSSERQKLFAKESWNQSLDLEDKDNKVSHQMRELQSVRPKSHHNNGMAAAAVAEADQTSCASISTDVWINSMGVDDTKIAFYIRHHYRYGPR